jgi:hypothetical protein
VEWAGAATGAVERAVERVDSINGATSRVHTSVCGVRLVACRAGVLNRPFSVVQLIERGGLSRITEDYIYIAETDHVLMRPLPNLATEDKAAAFGFGYMHAGMWHQSLITKFAPGTSYSQVG